MSSRACDGTYFTPGVMDPFGLNPNKEAAAIRLHQKFNTLPTGDYMVTNGPHVNFVSVTKAGANIVSAVVYSSTMEVVYLISFQQFGSGVIPTVTTPGLNAFFQALDVKGAWRNMELDHCGVPEAVVVSATAAAAAAATAAP